MTRGVIVLHGTEGRYTPGKPSRRWPTIRSSSSVVASSSESSSSLRAQLDNTGNGLLPSCVADRGNTPPRSTTPRRRRVVFHVATTTRIMMIRQILPRDRLVKAHLPRPDQRPSYHGMPNCRRVEG